MHLESYGKLFLGTLGVFFILLYFILLISGNNCAGDLLKWLLISAGVALVVTGGVAYWKGEHKNIRRGGYPTPYGY